MSSGHFIIGLVGSPWPGAGQEKTWEGTDGKYEVSVVGHYDIDGNYVQDLMRLKWNDYHMDAQTRFAAIPSIYGYYREGTPNAVRNTFTATDNGKLQQKLLQAIKEHDFDLGVNVAQGALTVGLVTQTLGTLGKSLVHLKHGRISDAISTLGKVPTKRRVRRVERINANDVSGRWLELQYGWLPLVSDSYEAFKAFHAITDGPRSTTVSARHSVKSSFLWGAYEPFYGDVPAYAYQKTTKTIIYEMSEVLSATRGLGLLDPLSIAWELIPYSFVVDWFIPIGTYLDNLGQIPYLRGRFLTSEKRYVTYESNPTGIPTWQGASIKWRRVELDRVVSSGLSTAFPSFKALPSAMSSRHIWNAIALAKQRFR